METGEDISHGHAQIRAYAKRQVKLLSSIFCKTKEGCGIGLKKVNWTLLILVLIGFVIGRFIGTYFEGTFLNYGQSFGLSEPVVLNLGFIVLTFGLTIQITIASVIGVIISLVVYRFIR